MTFDYDFPFCFDETSDFRKDYLLEIRDAGGRLIRRICQIFDATVTYQLNAPSILTVSIPTTDVSVNSLRGENEIWVRDQADALYGKFKVAERREHSSPAISTVSLKALSYMAQLSEEWIAEMHLRKAPLSDQLTAIFARQKSRSQITLGDIAATIGVEERGISISSPVSFMAIIQEWEQSLDYDTRFWVDSDRQFHWIVIGDQTATGHQFQIQKNLRSLERVIRYDHMATRIFAYGSEGSGRSLRLGDKEPDRNSGGVITTERQRWRFWATGATNGGITVSHTYAEHDDPQTIQGYDDGPISLRIGDLIVIEHDDGRRIERELASYSHSVAWGTTQLNFWPDIDPDADLDLPQRVYVERNFLDSNLRGALFKKMIRVDSADLPKDGTTYDLPVAWTDYDILEYAGQDNADFDLYFVAEDLETAVSATGVSFDVDTGAVAATLHITNPVPVYDAVVYMIFGRSQF